MKKFKKPFKFYFALFAISMILILGYSFYLMIFKDSVFSQVYPMWFLPPFFVTIYYGSDVLLDVMFNRKKKNDYENKFLEVIGERMRESKVFTIEDFRRLQLNMKFQECLTMAYHIYSDGENEVFTIEKLKRKFKKNTLEERAMKFVVAYLEENVNKIGNNE